MAGSLCVGQQVMSDNNWCTKLAQSNCVAGVMRSLAVGAFTFSAALALPSSVSAQSSDAQAYSKIIQIRPGDTLSHIAERELGNARHAQQLADSNNLDINIILKPGEELIVPVSLPVRDEHATVIFAKGIATLNGGDLKPDDKVRRNDEVETGTTGYASLEFQTGTIINLQPNTLARIVTLHCRSGDETCIIEMAAERGKLSTDVRRDGDQPTDFKVQTPYASAAVRGTKFDVDSDPTGLRIGVTEGNVALGAVSSDQVVDLDVGFGSASAAGSRLGSPIDLMPAPVFRFVPPRITATDVVRWFGLTDVERYTVQIAATAGGVGVIHDAVVEEDLFSHNDELPTGDYQLLVRAVDVNGLLGFIATSPVTLANVDPNIGEVNTVVTRENGNYRVEVIEAPDEATGYEIQVASDANFTDPVSIDVDENGLAFVRLNSDNVFARARALIDRVTVGPYGQPTTVDEE